MRDRIHIPKAVRELEIDLTPGLNHIHMSLATVQAYHPEFDLREFRVFAFYREPGSWFLSALSYKIMSTSHTFHVNMSPRAYWERAERMRKQTSILQGATDLFNYHDFTNETIRAFGELGLNLKPEDIPVKNKSVDQKRQLTQKDRDQIRYYWKEDYEFFENRGIRFD